MKTRESIQKKLLEGYQNFYDIESRKEEWKNPYLEAKCFYHEENAGYVFSKKNALWRADRYEHLYLFSVRHLNENIYKECCEFSMKDGMELIHLQSGHMCTYITAIFLCETFDMGVKKVLQRCRKRKDFCFGLQGWMEFHTVLIDDDRQVFSNRAGKEQKKYLKKLLED